MAGPRSTYTLPCSTCPSPPARPPRSPRAAPAAAAHSLALNTPACPGTSAPRRDGAAEACEAPAPPSRRVFTPRRPQPRAGGDGRGPASPSPQLQGSLSQASQHPQHRAHLRENPASSVAESKPSSCELLARSPLQKNIPVLWQTTQTFNIRKKLEHTDICQPALSDIFSDYQKRRTTWGTNAISRDSVLDPGGCHPQQIQEAMRTPPWDGRAAGQSPGLPAPAGRHGSQFLEGSLAN